MKQKLAPTPFEEWTLKNLDSAVGVPMSAFNFPGHGTSRGCYVLVLVVISAGGKAGDNAAAQGLDLRTREGVVTLLQSVYQLRPTHLVKSNRLWIFNVPADYPYEKLRRGVFALSQSVGFALLKPSSLALRTVAGFVSDFWGTAEEAHHILDGDLFESLEVQVEKVSPNSPLTVQMMLS
jgi:hypothetical protein